MHSEYRIERARLRDYHVAILDSVDGCHRAMAHGDLEGAARYADDLRVLGSSVQATVQRIRNLVERAHRGGAG